MAAVIWAVIAMLLIAAVWNRRRPRRRAHVGPGASGTVYDWLNEDKRRAVEIIVEERAEATDPETADGNLPDLVDPKR